MATLTAANVISRVSTLLQDTTNIRWPVAELLQYISDAQREIVAFKPDACVKTAVSTLAAGTKQALPADGTTLIDITRNMGTNGTTPGRAPRLVTREILDAQNPNWHAGTPAAEVVHYTFDPQNQKAFYVYPPQPASGQGSLELIYAAAPSEVAQGGSLQLDDTWMPAIVNYALYRCYSKDAEYAANANLAVAYYQAFNAQMVGRTSAEQAVDVNRNSAANPLVRARA
ncbi:DUF6682 family protein [Thauera aromatica]|uniref:phage adaptor protein n=1 Tax=Thauera aromatica TaxID=59405 RepID=UPI001FFC6606|nr:DUF6682 family protein [Thauera aromatica]MCK2097522.1 hypothetical protein [Thauera aromatica]